MGCSHCLSDCRKDGNHITLEQFKKNVQWALPLTATQPLLISGGEPFEHPQIKEILEYIEEVVKTRRLRRKGAVVVATNGSPLVDDSSLYNWYSDYVKRNSWIITQITSIPKYYPRKYTTREYYRLQKLTRSFMETSENDIVLYPQGRALNLPEEDYRTNAPKCINSILISVQKPFRDSYELFNMITGNAFKFCAPRFNIDGTIALGESRLCPTVGNVDMSAREILDNIKNFKCFNCEYSWKVFNENPLKAARVIE
jgi:organic radical activating enzyme